MQTVGPTTIQANVFLKQDTLHFCYESVTVIIVILKSLSCLFTHTCCKSMSFFFLLRKNPQQKVIFPYNESEWSRQTPKH